MNQEKNRKNHFRKASTTFKHQYWSKSFKRNRKRQRIFVKQANEPFLIWWIRGAADSLCSRSTAAPVRRGLRVIEQSVWRARSDWCCQLAEHRTNYFDWRSDFDCCSGCWPLGNYCDQARRGSWGAGGSCIPRLHSRTTECLHFQWLHKEIEEAERNFWQTLSIRKRRQLSDTTLIGWHHSWVWMTTRRYLRWLLMSCETAVSRYRKRCP